MCDTTSSSRNPARCSAVHAMPSQSGFQGPSHVFILQLLLNEADEGVSAALQLRRRAALEEPVKPDTAAGIAKTTTGNSTRLSG